MYDRILTMNRRTK